MEQVCCVCSKEGAKRCSKCKLQYYCSKECQQSDWKNHKVVCRKGNSEETSVAKLHDTCSIYSKERSKKCSNYKLQNYCNKECLQSNWKSDRNLCSELNQRSVNLIHDICSVCLKEGAKKCSRCKVQLYCSKECQQKDWKNHKTVCKLNKRPLNLTQNVCCICYKEAAKRCSKCKVQFYCSTECQQSDWKNHKTLCNELNQTSLNLAQDICSVCLKEGAKRCSRCKVQFYCSKECQQKDWKNHKNVCNELHQRSVGLAQDICSVCSKEGTKKCNKCEVKFYYSRECQKKDWKNHRTICEDTGNVVEFTNSSEPPSEFLGTQKEMLSQFLSMAPSETLTFVPKYHKEYQSVYPNDKMHYEILRDSWILAKTLDDSAFGDRIIESSRHYGSEDMTKRWQYFGPALEEFLRGDPKPGDIFIGRISEPYGKSIDDVGSRNDIFIHQTIRNSPVSCMEFHFDSTYVFIGFVDLFPLLVGSFRSDLASSKRPLSFIGYDKSEVVIARSIVIYEMMVNRLSSDSILQVWFSSGWNEKTQEDFQKICRNLKTKQFKTDERVKKLLNHWTASKISAEEVLPTVKRLIEDYQLLPLNILRYEKDRLAYARYIFTGQIFGKNDKDYVFGNVTMFSFPSDVYRYVNMKEDNIFAALSMNKFTYEGSLIKSLTTKLTKGLATLVEHITSKRVICKFLFRDLSMGDVATLDDIKKLNARVIDWSNIPDYLPVNDFFTMAKMCSSSDTTHSMHFMNWPGYVFGASLLDYPDKSGVYKILKKAMVQKYEKVKENRPFLRQDQYLHYYMNIADRMLSERYRQNFINYVMTGRDVVVSEPTSEEFNPFERCNACFFFSFKFNK